jgi:hypothetical protein
MCNGTSYQKNHHNIITHHTNPETINASTLPLCFLTPPPPWRELISNHKPTTSRVQSQTIFSPKLHLSCLLPCGSNNLFIIPHIALSFIEHHYTVGILHLKVSSVIIFCSPEIWPLLYYCSFLHLFI